MNDSASRSIETDAETNVSSTETHSQYELKCSLCGKPATVDKKTFECFKHSTEHGFEDVFLCPACELEYDELAFEK